MTNTHTEAPASLNFTAYTPRGYRVQMTLRDESEGNLLERFKTTIGIVQDLGWSWSMTPQPQNGAKPPELPTQGSGAPPVATAVPLAAPADSEVMDSFSAETLVANVNEGKAYWKVQGGPFTKFGVTIWPEVLNEAGFDCDQLDSTQTYSLAGHTATYTKVDGKPKKVTLLTK
jgi:hypothetical protein